jgi:aminoglycoside phosphotransferase (APT) family kinase protein
MIMPLAEQALATLDIEPHMAAILDRRLKKRLQGPYRPRSEAEVAPRLQQFVNLQPGFEQSTISNVARLSGGASKEQFRFDVADGAGQSQRFVIRMDPLESVVETSRSREFEAMRAFEGVIPVPHAQWLDPDGRHMGEPAVFTTFIGGVTKPAGAPGANVSGLGTNIGASWRREMGDQFLQHLAAMHAVKWDAAVFPSYSLPDADPLQSARRHLDWWTRVWLEDAVDMHPVFPVIDGWLRDNMPPCSEFVFCHNDYRTGNYLINEDTRKISAILDWELSHWGDFHDELAGIIPKVLGHLDEKGEFLVSGLMSRAEFLDRYCQLTGRTIDPKTLHYYEVLQNYKSLVVILGSAYRVAIEQNNHQNVLQTWLCPAGHVFLAEICRLFEEGPQP